VAVHKSYSKELIVVTKTNFNVAHSSQTIQSHIPVQNLSSEALSALPPLLSAQFIISIVTKHHY